MSVLTATTPCRPQLTKNADTRCAASTQCAMASVNNTRRALPAPPSTSAATRDYRTSRRVMHASAVSATRTLQPIRCVTCADARRHPSSTTSRLTVAYRPSSGINATGKDCACAVTASRQHARSGVAGTRQLLVQASGKYLTPRPRNSSRSATAPPVPREATRRLAGSNPAGDSVAAVPVQAEATALHPAVASLRLVATPPPGEVKKVSNISAGMRSEERRVGKECA